MNRKRIVILGTNEYQNPLILRAKELGYETHVFGWKTGNIGEKTADFYHNVNILDYDALWENVSKLGAVGVVSIASEVAMPAVHYLLRKMNIPCNSKETDDIATNKYLMRCALRDAGIPGPKFMLIENILTDYSLVKDFKFPLIAKPIDLSSSRGVVKIDNLDELNQGIEYALNWSEEKKVILEEYIGGQEYSGESIAYNGKYKLLTITEKTTTGAPHFVETGHRQPANLSEEMFKKVEERLYSAFKAMGIKYGAVHPEFKITEDGEIIFMEIGARMGGDCIGSDLVPLSTGYDYMGMVISIGCGKAPSFELIGTPGTSEIKYIINEQDLEEFEYIKNNSPEKIYRYSEDIHELKKNSEILKSADRPGYYIMKY